MSNASVPNQPDPEREARPSSILARIERAAFHHAETTALEFGSTRLSYAGLLRQADHLAARLAAAGVGRDTAVGLHCPRGLEALIAWTAILKSGGAIVPLDPAYPAERLRHMAKVAQIRHIVVPSAEADADGIADLPAIRIPISSSREADTPQAPALPVRRPEDLLYILFTSGSTGTPKGVAMPDRVLDNLVAWQETVLPVTPGTRVLQFAPGSFDVSFQEIASTLAGGGTLVLIDEDQRRDPAALLAVIRRHRVERLFLPVVMLHELVREYLSAAEPPPLPVRDIITAGEQLRVTDAVRRFFSAHPQCRLHNHYGPTETHVVTAATLSGAPDTWPDLPAIGAPIPGAAIHLLDDARRPVADGTEGELYIGGLVLARGYHNDASRTAASFIEIDLGDGSGPQRLYRTGDLARRLPTGEFAYLGRADDQVKINGFRIELGEVETTLEKHPAVAACAAAAVANPHTGSRNLAAWVVPGDATTPARLPETLRAFLAERLPPHAVPAIIRTIDALPRTPSGKIDRRTLAAGLQDTFPKTAPAREGPSPAKGGEPLSTLQAIWSAILHIEEIPPHADLFELGANSISVARAAREIARRTGHRIATARLFEHRTCAAQAALIAHTHPSPEQAKSDTAEATDAAQRAAAPRADAGIEDSDDFPSDAIAIIGMAGRFPGAASVDDFWSASLAGLDLLTRFDPATLIRVPEHLRNHPGYVPVRGVLEQADCFDAAFFGISPREADLMDPQHRVFLECCWHALEDAGAVRERSRLITGVFAGQSLNTYLLNNLSPDRARIDAFLAQHQTGELATLLGNDKDFLATRVAHKLDLRGPALTVQAGCSTSLVAVVQAARSLLAGECDMCLAGGVSLSFPQERGHLHSEGSIASRDGTCRPFDADASGTVFGGGAGVVVLKRLRDALAAGDRIHAVIRGCALNNDGAQKSSFSAPSVEGQRRVITEALRRARVTADTIGYVETHGTGTPLGDPIELTGLNDAFAAAGATPGNTCWLGSAKANIGHLEAAAGIAGLIRAACAVRDGMIPPMAHFTRPNEHLDLEGTPFRIPTEPTPWSELGTPRRAGVSSLGIGGTNAHVVLEQAPALPAATLHRPPARPEAFLLSGKTPEAATRHAARLAAFLDRTDNVGTDLLRVAHTLRAGREHFRFRIAVAAASSEELAARLRQPPVPVEAPADKPPRIVFMFPGQGSQRAGMARDLHAAEPVFRETVERLLETLEPPAASTIRKALLAPPDDPEAAETLRQTRYTQPALFIVELALARLLQHWGIQPQAMLGHSVGEYVAATLAGVFSEADALRAVTRRGELIQALPAGAMLSVRADEASVRARLTDTLDLAAVNAPGLCVVAGPGTAIDAFAAALEKDGIANRKLVTSHAFHSRMMDPAVEPLREMLAAVPRAAPTILVHSTVTAGPLGEEQATDPLYWARHARLPVRFADALASAAAEPGTILVEVGPGRTLAQLARSHHGLRDRLAEILSPLELALDGPDAATTAAAVLGRLWCHGLSPDWHAFRPETVGPVISLPGYPFAREKHWIEPPAPSGTPESGRSGLNNFQNPPHADQPPTCAPQSMENTQPDRHARILEAVYALLEENYGDSLDRTNPHACFFELGFDSLLLTSLAQAVSEKFGLALTFSDLTGELNSPEALTAHLAQHLPPDAFAPSPPSAASTETPASAPASPARPAPRLPSLPAGPAADAHTRQVIEQQLEIMRRQLELLGAATTAPQPAPAPSPSPAKPPAAAPDDADDAAKPARHGPFRPLSATARDELTPAQREHILELTAAYNARTAKSKDYAQKHRRHFCDPRAAGGFKAVWKEMVYPLVAARSKGAHVWDIDGNEYIDVTMGFGANFLGHSPDFVTEAVERQLRLGVEIGPQNALAGEVAAMLCEMTGMERATFCNTGSEAVMAAMRVARTVTGRPKIVVFAGDYHGMFDSVLVRKGRRDGEPAALPIAPGIPRSQVEDIVVLDYGADASLAWIDSHADCIAGVLVEPVQARNPDLQPRAFLQQLRRITAEHGCALIFDEVITGFRCHPGGAQAWFDVRADLATYGKVIGGGMPIGVLAGSRRWMDVLDGGHWQFGDDSYPQVGVTFFAGTFVRHPLAMAAAHASLQWLKARGHTPQETANALTGELADRVNAAFARRGIDAHLAHFSSFFHLHFAEEPPHAGLLFYHLRHRGIHIWEGRVGFLSVAHTPEDVDRIAGAFEESIDAMAGVGLLRAARPTPPQDDRGGSPASGESPRSVPLTDAQRELFLAASFGREANAALNISMTIRLRGDADHGALRSAITDVVHRHESLRCTFAPDGSTQTIHPPGPVDILEAPYAPGTAEFAAWVREVCSTPFDLEKGPVFRFWIASSGHETQVIFIAHHIACDGWSCDTLIRDLAACYNARTAGREPSLPPAESLTAWALGEAERRTSKARKDALAFWRERLADPPPPPPLPEDFPRPRRPSYRGETIHRKLTAEVRSRLESLVASARATPFGLLYTTFSILIHRLSGVTDLLIGIPVAGQNVYRKHSLVAHCVKYLPTRVRIDPSLSFRELVNRTQVELFKQIAHAHVSLGDLTRELRWRPDPSRPSSVGLAFNLDPALDDIAFDGLEFSAFQNHSEYFNAELAFNAILGPDEIVLEASYNTDVFAGQTVYNWLAAFETLLCDCIQSPDTPIGDLAFTVDRCDAASTPAPVEAEQEALLLHQLFEHQASQTPEAIAVVDGDTRLSYDALDVRANRLAHLLVERGAAADERVALFFERSADFVIALLAVLKSGAAVVPIDPSWPAERQRQVLATADPLIAIAPTVDAFPDALPEKVHLVSFAEDAPDIAARPTTAPAIATRPEHLAYVLFTSGSTGEPKGVMIEHRAVVAHIPSIARVYGIGAEDVSLLFHSVAFDPTIEQIFCALTCGGRLVIRGPELWTPAEFAAVVAREKLTVIDLPPSYCVQLLQGWLDDSPVRGALDSLRLIILGGEPMPPRAIELWRALGLRRTRLINSYGPTEATITATTWEVPFDAEAFPTEAEAIPIGRPHGPVGVHVIDDQGQPVPAGGIGELCLSGPTLARGYLGHPEVTAARFAPAPFDPGLRIYRTGDRVRLRPDGLLEFRERIDRQIKLRGYRVELGEIESHLVRHPDVAEAAVVVHQTTTGSPVLHAWVRGTGPALPEEADLKAWLADRLPHYMIPAAIHAITELPTDANGKIDRRALAARIAETDAGPSSSQPQGQTPPVEDTPGASGTPEALAAVLKRHPLVAEAVAIEHAADGGAPALHAFVTPTGGTEISETILQRFVRDAAPDTPPPDAIHIVDTLPAGADGGIDRDALRARAAASQPAREQDRGSGSEAAILAIWRRLLENPALAATDDVFAHGAHSLLAMQAVQAIARETGARLSIADILENPSAAALARIVGTAPADSASPAAPSATPSGATLFNIPGVYGYGLIPAPLAEAIAADRAYFDGLQLPGADGLEPPLETLEAMAEHLVRQILEVQPDGAYALTGYCTGGPLAFEVARQLEEAGKLVSAVVVWDAVPDYLWKPVPGLRRLLEKGRKATPSRVAAAITRRLKADAPGNEAAGTTGEAAMEESPIVAATDRAAAAYRFPRPLRGRLYVALSRNPSSGDLEMPPLGGWDQIQPTGLKVESLDCDHLEMIREPWLTRVSQLTAAWLREADAEIRLPETSAAPAGTFPRPLGGGNPANAAQRGRKQRLRTSPRTMPRP